MKSIPVLTIEQLEALTEPEIKALVRKQTKHSLQTIGESDEAVPYFFVRTENGKKVFKLPPKLEIRVVSR